MEAKAKAIRISPRKVRLVADAIRNKSANQALTMLSVMQQRVAITLTKTIKSAIANALHNAKKDQNVQADLLVIKSIDVNEGTPLKRFHPSTRGRVHSYKKRSSSIHIVLEQKGGKN